MAPADGELVGGDDGHWLACGAKRVLQNLSDSNDVDVVIEATEVFRIGREHSGATIACSYCHGRIDDVAGVGHPADLPAARAWWSSRASTLQSGDPRSRASLA